MQKHEIHSDVIYLMLDEWGYFESGHMGNRDRPAEVPSQGFYRNSFSRKSKRNRRLDKKGL